MTGLQDFQVKSVAPDDAPTERGRHAAARLADAALRGRQHRPGDSPVLSTLRPGIRGSRGGSPGVAGRHKASPNPRVTSARQLSLQTSDGPNPFSGGAPALGVRCVGLPRCRLFQRHVFQSQS